ncbi:MAG: arginine repressor [Peptococcaceae bacterium]|nr:arginine repressor [Peptococcaceae bacterium]
MKSRRQKKIQELITEQTIRTQEELCLQLNAYGFTATQATISRDIKELGLVKVPGPGDDYRYAMANEAQTVGVQERLDKVCRDIVTSCDCSDNLVVIKTLPGNAQALAVLLDNVGWQEILGTIAGDDTVFVAVRQRAGAEVVRKRVQMAIDY